jgi:hypothetical protein
MGGLGFTIVPRLLRQGRCLVTGAPNDGESESKPLEIRNMGIYTILPKQHLCLFQYLYNNLICVIFV